MKLDKLRRASQFSGHKCSSYILCTWRPEILGQFTLNRILNLTLNLNLNLLFSYFSSNSFFVSIKLPAVIRYRYTPLASFEPSNVTL